MMIETILETKLFIPPLRPSFVPRKRLVDQLSSSHNCKLTLISAPAGYGKTTLVSEWIAGCNKPTAWLSLDIKDNDISRFLTYFVSALDYPEEIDFEDIAELLDMIQAPQLPAVDVILSAVINKITQIPDDFLFILDDYHVIENEAINDSISFLLENLPPQMHLVIATREDPLFAFGRLRAQGYLTELRAIDLRFTSSEAAEFLSQVMHLNLSKEDISALEDRTEGWIAGLQLAALSMQGQKDTSALINAFTGSHRFILDYLIEEVLDQQSEDILSFLLQTSILNRLSASLCNFLTGLTTSQETLEKLEHSNLFTIPLDNERKWYRYHHLFSELLERRAKSTYPDNIKELHKKASFWLEKDGNISEAIHHAIQGDDLQAATRLIEEGALRALEVSNFSFIFNSVNLLPDNLLEQSPWLFIYHTLALLLTGQIEMAIPRLENTNWLVETTDHHDDSNLEIQGYIAGAQTLLAGWQRDSEKIKKFTRLAEKYLHENHWILAYCHMMVGTNYWETGNLLEAEKSFDKAYGIGKHTGNNRVISVSTVYMAYTQEMGGNLQRAVQIHELAFKHAQQNGRFLPTACYTHIELAKILYERNELEQAAKHLEQGILLTQRISDDRVENIAHRFMTRIHIAQGDLINAEKELKLSRLFSTSEDIQYDMRGGEYLQIWHWLKQNNLADIRIWLTNNLRNLDDNQLFTAKLTQTMYARAMIALAEEYTDPSYLNDACALLDELLKMVEPNGWKKKHIEILALRASAFQAQGKADRAMKSLEKAITLAEQEGFVRTFVDEGPKMEALLRRLKSDNVLVKNYVHKLLSAFETNTAQQAQKPDQPLIEPLSERELEVLELIAKGLSNQEIAAKLYLSLNTVKVHTRNIYGKLGTNNRTQAAAKAQSLGIIKIKVEENIEQ